jgi:hypothetical protein
MPEPRPDWQNVNAAFSRRQLVGKLRPFAFDDDAHFVGDDRDAIHLDKIVVKALEVIGRHAFAIDGVAPDRFLRHRPQSSSASRFTAGALGSRDE